MLKRLVLTFVLILPAAAVWAQSLGPDAATSSRNFELRAFRTDPDWTEAKAASEIDGPLTAKVESVFLGATDYSPLK